MKTVLPNDLQQSYHSLVQCDFIFAAICTNPSGGLAKVGPHLAHPLEIARLD